MNSKDQIDNLVKKIQGAHKGKQFPNYIEQIRFPYYKSLSPKAKITFDFPLTMLVGINGSGKSSALHALYGCPDRSSTGDFWFSTPLDPIATNGVKGEIPSFIYTYKDGKKSLEVIKRRVGVAKGLDYWETSRPIAMYGMTPLKEGKRNRPVKKKVKFLDFRSELSAFDKFFHFGQYKTRKTITSKQDYLRKYSEYVKRGFSSNKAISVYNKLGKKPRQASKESLEAIANILGKAYSQCNVLFHDYYGEEGTTILFKHNRKNYSEAFAGRGEFAVAKLIYEIADAEEGSLIILDEPEVSLHPSAQEKLKLYLLEVCLKKKLQIIVSTHSSKLIEFLPDEAIKLFYEEDSGEFNVINLCSYFQAFAKIGETINKSHQKTIVVEDSLGKDILDLVIESLGKDYPLLFNIVYFPGGAEDIYKSSVLYSQEREELKYIILDGDKKKPQFDTSSFSVKDASDFNFLERKLKEATNSEFKKLGFKVDGNTEGGNQNQMIEAVINYLDFNKSNLAYFPLNTPEEFIWDEEYANKLLAADGNKMPKMPDDYKKKFKKFSELFYQGSTGKEISMAQKKFIQNFIRKKDDNYRAIVEILKKFHGDSKNKNLL
ncbi:AAA family ATPase [Pedobacter helvus]|uniref:AAA family ATPase n=1 Tax=Pedobacter helvus TaxID=2563444 RepID=A0ABW9JHB9_9SPHI|nr:AAA family ATPase [Pedobacter ureilyticus]